MGYFRANAKGWSSLEATFLLPRQKGDLLILFVPGHFSQHAACYWNSELMEQLRFAARGLCHHVLLVGAGSNIPEALGAVVLHAALQVVACEDGLPAL